MSRRTWILGVGAVVALAAFLLFRPDKLFVDDRVDESLEQAFTTTTTVGSATTEGTTATTAPNPDPTTTTAPPGPVVLASGSFTGIDHRASGTATVYHQEGLHVLRFEDDTDIQNGPDLYVWVLPSDDYRGGTPEEYLDLGRLKGNVGGQNYELPPEYDPEVDRAVLIWCLRFGVPFALAPLEG